MKFEMWSPFHIVYMLSPFIIIGLLYLLLRKRSYTTRYVVGCIIGVLSLGVLIMRNVYIYKCNGFDPEIIPLQVCHFGNIMVFISLIFRSKIATSVAWSLNMFATYSSIVFADSLTHYGNILTDIRAEAYVWGHLLIVVGAAYAVLLKVVRIDIKSFLYGLLVLVMLVIPSIILNPYFNNVKGNGINYFYIYNSNGVPFEFLWNDSFTHSYGSWFQINYVYTFSVIGIFLVIIFGIYCSQKLFYLHDKDYDTYNIFYK